MKKLKTKKRSIARWSNVLERRSVIIGGQVFRKITKRRRSGYFHR